MPPPAHANFAAAVVLSESFVNDCLDAYLTEADAGGHTTASWTAPITVNGASLTFQATADFQILSVRAQLRGPTSRGIYGQISESSKAREQGKKIYGRLGTGTKSAPRPRMSGVTLSLRFFATTTVQVLQGSTVVETYTPTAVIEAYDYDPKLFAVVLNDQFAFAFDLDNSHLEGATAQVLDVGMSPPYRAQLKAFLESPTGVAALDALLHALAKAYLQTTSLTLPAHYDFSMPRLIKKGLESHWETRHSDDVTIGGVVIVGKTEDVLVTKVVDLPEPWFEVHSAASRLVWKPLDGCLVAAIDVPGYTSGSLSDLRDFRADDPQWRDCDVASTLNLRFIEEFLSREVFPVMRNAHLETRVRLNKVNGLVFKPIYHDMYGDLHGFELEVDVTYWTNFPAYVDGLLFRDSSAIDVTVRITAHPYLLHGRLSVSIFDVDVDLPWWVYAVGGMALFNLSVTLPVLSFVLPGFLMDVVQQAKDNAIRAANGKAADNALRTDRDFVLPDTHGPTYHFAAKRFEFHTAPDEKHATVYAQVRRKERPALEVSFEGHTVEVPAGDPRYAIRKEFALPVMIWAGLVVPPGFAPAHDPTLRVRWQTFLNGRPVPEYTRDFPYPDPRARGLGIQTFHIVNPNRVDQELEIDCRFYRQLGPTTEDLLNSSVRIISDDPRPDSVKPYVRWSHNVKYWDGFKPVSVRRTSKIHKAPGKGGCRFSNQYLLPQRGHAAWKFYDVRYLGALPFDERFIERYRDLVCPYCFFGGPDKHAGDPLSGVDFSGVVGKLYTYAHEYVHP
jgi:hypothetical protein